MSSAPSLLRGDLAAAARDATQQPGNLNLEGPNIDVGMESDGSFDYFDGADDDLGSGLGSQPSSLERLASQPSVSTLERLDSPASPSLESRLLGNVGAAPSYSSYRRRRFRFGSQQESAAESPTASDRPRIRFNTRTSRNSNTDNAADSSSNGESSEALRFRFGSQQESAAESPTASDRPRIRFNTRASRNNVTDNAAGRSTSSAVGSSEALQQRLVDIRAIGDRVRETNDRIQRDLRSSFEDNIFGFGSTDSLDDMPPLERRARRPVPFRFSDAHGPPELNVPDEPSAPAAPAAETDAERIARLERERSGMRDSAQRYRRHYASDVSLAMEDQERETAAQRYRRHYYASDITLAMEDQQRETAAAAAAASSRSSSNLADALAESERAGYSELSASTGRRRIVRLSQEERAARRASFQDHLRRRRQNRLREEEERRRASFQDHLRRRRQNRLQEEEERRDADDNIGYSIGQLLFEGMHGISQEPAVASAGASHEVDSDDQNEIMVVDHDNDNDDAEGNDDDESYFSDGPPASHTRSQTDVSSSTAAVGASSSPATAAPSATAASPSSPSLGSTSSASAQNAEPGLKTTGLDKNDDKDDAETEEAVDNDDKKPTANEQHCSICLDVPTRAEKTKLNNCEHIFCFGCIETWADRENSCPLCKVRFTKIERVHKPKVCKKRKNDGKEGAARATKCIRNRDQRADLVSANPLQGMFEALEASGSLPRSIAQLIFSGLGGINRSAGSASTTAQSGAAASSSNSTHPGASLNAARRNRQTVAFSSSTTTSHRRSVRLSSSAASSAPAPSQGASIQVSSSAGSVNVVPGTSRVSVTLNGPGSASVTAGGASRLSIDYPGLFGDPFDDLFGDDRTGGYNYFVRRARRSAASASSSGAGRRGRARAASAASARSSRTSRSSAPPANAADGAIEIGDSDSDDGEGEIICID